MTNMAIIAEVAVAMYGEEAVERMIEEHGEIPLHTLKVWSQRGYNVRKGVHGIETRLWKKRKKKDDTSEEEGTAEEQKKGDFYLAKAYLFSPDQLIKREE